MLEQYNAILVIMNITRGIYEYYDIFFSDL